MAKKIYMGKSYDYVNQRLANFVVEKQLQTWDDNNLHKYKNMHPTLKAWIIFESKFNFLISQQLTLSIKAKINPIDNRK